MANNDNQNLIKWNEQGNKAFAAGRYDQAQEFYELALELAPDNQTIIFNLGTAYQAQGEADKAILCYERVSGIPEAKNNLGVIFESQGEHSLAWEAYQAALKLEPQFDMARENIVRLEKKFGGRLRGPSPSIGITDFSVEELRAVRESGAYRDLRQALINKKITLADAELEAEAENSNLSLAKEQRVYLVLLADMKAEESSALMPADKSGVHLVDLATLAPSRLDRANGYRIKDPAIKEKIAESLPSGSKPAAQDSAEILVAIKKTLGSNFGAGWTGIDGDGDLLEVREVSADHWVKFQVDHLNGKIETFSFPLAAFYKKVALKNLYPLDQAEAKSLESKNLALMDDQSRLNLLEKFQLKAVSEIKRLKSKQREIIEGLMRKNEDQKIQEVMAKIGEV